MARATRTLNPLHFEDLEPHRFEDLVRQLAYEYRPWTSIEATGRGGADDGIDIRAFEPGSAPLTEEGDEEDGFAPITPGRLWIIQCKREKRIGPAQVRRYVEESVQGPDVPYGFILAAACDFSKKGYDAFRLALLGTGVQEFHLWGKAELEDMLFQPKNDHLLFAYFGISLQTRKRSVQSELRATLALRKRVGRILGGTTNSSEKDVLFRIAGDERYPDTTSIPDFDANPRWAIYRVDCLNMRNNLVLELRRHLAYLDPETDEWDALSHFWQRTSHDLYGRQQPFDSAYAGHYTDWQQLVPADRRADLVAFNIVPLSRVLGVDEDGDLGHPLPTLYIEPAQNGKILDLSSEIYSIERTTFYGHASEYRPSKEKRVNFFKENRLEEK